LLRCCCISERTLEMGSNSLELGQSIGAGEFLNSTFYGLSLVLQLDGNLQLFRRRRASSTVRLIWQSSTSGETCPACYRLQLQPDGNLVLADERRGQLLWNSSLSAPAGADGDTRLLVEERGALVIKSGRGKVLFEISGACFGSTGHFSIFSFCAYSIEHGKNVLQNGAALFPGESLVSPNGFYRCRLKSNGNLQLEEKLSKDPPEWKLLWQSNTEGACLGWCKLKMKPNGDAMLYSNFIENMCASLPVF